MIRKLRVKFVVINMALVALVLAVVFTLVLVSSAQQNRANTMNVMRMALERDDGAGPPRFFIGQKEKPPEQRHHDAGLVPIFTVTVDENGGVQAVDTGNVELEEGVVQEAVAYVLAQDAPEGTVGAMNLRFLLRQTASGMRIVFADRSVESGVFWQMALTLLLMGFLGLLAFFAISLFLSRWALRPVEKAWAQQQQFVADASHELKTPLTAILANINILQQHPQDTVGAQAHWIDNTQTEAMCMKKLVDDLLYLAKTDAARLPLSKSEFSLSDAVLSCLLPFEPVAFEQGVLLESDVPPDIRMLGEETKIKQLVVILLDNACKFAGKNGKVWLSLQKAQDRAVLVVKNTGEAIGGEDLPHIFERFYRADKARVHQQGGYGLGLSIAAQIVKGHQGRIAAESVDGWTTFTVSLPDRRA